jgi:DDE superfamily endonuclease
MRLAQAHPRWVVGFEDEVWWSRLAQPEQHRWVGEGERTRLQELERAKEDKQAKAVACSGVLVRQAANQDRMLLRFVEGRPVSDVTSDCLEWWSERLAQHGVRAWLLIWDTASWHTSEKVRRRLREHNRVVKATGEGVRIVGCLLPSKSPWLNPIEPKWVHGKRAVSEAERLLTAEELEARVCAYYGCPQETHLLMPQEVA